MATVDWDVDQFASKVTSGIYSEKNLAKELERLGKYFKLPEFGRQTEPSTIVDQHGHILVWHLPDILSIQRVVRSQNHFLPSIYSNLVNLLGRL